MVKRESSSTRENMNKVITVAKKESDDDEDEEEESKDDEDEDKKETSTKDYIKRKVEMLMEEDARMKAATAAAKNKPTTKRVGFDRKQTGRPSRQKDVSIKKNDDDDDDDESESNSSTRTFDHHERLRQICSFALDLQTKIEQTKLVLERIGNETNPAPAQLNEPLRQSRRSPRVRRRTDSSPKATTPVLLLPLPLSLSPRKSASFSVSQSIDSTTTLPGVKVYKTDTVAMTRDLAARRIQSAYRLYLSRRPDHSRRKPPARPNPNYSIANRKTTRPVPKIPQPKIDEYNFINVFHKKRGTVFSSPRKDSPNRKIKKSSSSNIAKTGSMSESKHHRSTHNQPNYTEDFVTNRTGSLRGNENEKSGGGQSRLAEETDEHSSIKSNLEVSSTSSSSTSLSKYVNKSPVSRKSDPRASTATLTGEIDERPEIEINERMGSSRAARSDVTTSQSSRRSSEEEEERQVAPSHRGNVMHEIEPSSTSSPSFSSSSEVRKLKTATKVARTLRVMAEPSSNRYSPSSLERLLNINMNYLDTLNVSAVQIEELDKVRCVGRAQQETVALAYMLKV